MIAFFLEHKKHQQSAALPDWAQQEFVAASKTFTKMEK